MHVRSRYASRHDSGQVLIAIGDVAGHGLAAAAGMARLRGALVGLAVTGAPPPRLVGWLNDLVHLVAPEHTASVMAGYFDPATRSLTWAQAGHPGPVLVRGVTDPVRVIAAALRALGSTDAEDGTCLVALRVL